MKGALLVAGTSSDAGKSVVVAALCRSLARRGVRVAPYKAQNMSLNSVVAVDGAEIGRAQAMQAAAAGIDAEGAMNPVLLKPGGNSTSQVVVNGRPYADVDALSYRTLAPELRAIALDALADLRARFDVVICEGAGSPAEINLRDTDIVNMGLAQPAQLPVVVVGDIDRGGVFASMYGTLALLDDADQALIRGWIVNKFRGDVRLLQPGLDRLTALTNRPVYGVLPWLDGLWLDVEDSLDLASYADSSDGDALRVVVIRLPRISNFTDIDALASEPHVSVRFSTAPVDVADADLVIVPGTRATVEDLAWLRRVGLADSLIARAAKGRPILGVCGGYQLLGTTIDDGVESKAGVVEGLGVLPVRTTFAAEKTLGRPSGSYGEHDVTAYEIHHGVVTLDGGEPLFTTATGSEGCRSGATWGTVWHGALENDGFRRAFLTEVAAAAGREFRPGADTFASARQRRLDALADHVDAHLDMQAIEDVIVAAG